MISTREVFSLRDEWLLRSDVIEKDWALGWLLAGIAANLDLGAWVFKGGTCLRKCYYETYRFSEDLDFTVAGDGPTDVREITALFAPVAEWLADHAGLMLVIDERSFVQRQNRRGKPTVLGRVAFRGPTNPPTLAKIKIDLTADEVLVDRPIKRTVLHPYSDALPDPASISCYTIVELLAEKLRARRALPATGSLRHRARASPSRSPGASSRSRRGPRPEVCACRNPRPDLESIHRSPYRAEIESEWANMLAHQLPSLPPFSQFWDALDRVFAWLDGRVTVPTLGRAEVGQLDSDWQAPRSMTTWRTGAPLELIRFAGANRLKVDVDYRADQGRQGSRTIEPYALRRTRDGNIVLFVVNDRGLLRSYRIDRIAGVSVTRESFEPRYVVEF